MSLNQTVYEDTIGKFVWDPEAKVMFHTYNDDSQFATDEEFKEHLIKFGEKILEYKPVGIIEDYKTMKFVAGVELLEWIGKELKPKLVQAGVKRYAKLVSEDYISQLMAEQVVEEARQKNPGAIPDGTFLTLEEALEWAKKV